MWGEQQYIQQQVVSMTAEASHLQHKPNKVRSTEAAQCVIQSIYDGLVSGEQASRRTSDIQADLGYGTVYTIIRETLQTTCKKHRAIISDSVVAYTKSIGNYHRINWGAEEQQQEGDNKLLEAIVNLVYYHFSNIANANKLVCQLWDSIKAKLNGFKTSSDYTIRAPELKLSILDLLALKELVPSSGALSPNNFKQVLQKLLVSKSTTHKQHIQEMIKVYRLPETLENSQGITKFQNAQRQIKKMKQQESDDESDWLKRAKQNPIARKLAQRLGGKFYKDEDKKLSMSDLVVEDLAKGILSKNLFQMGLGREFPAFRVIGGSETSKKVHKQEVQEEVKAPQLNEVGQKRKKRKNRNKKKKQKAEESSQQQTEMIQKPRNDPLNQIEVREYGQTIKLLKQMKIDDKRRSNCVLQMKTLQDWKKNLQHW